MAAKDKDKKGPSTQRTATQGVDAVGVNHGTNKGYVAYSTYSPDAAPVPGKKFNVVGVPGATVAPAPWGVQQPAQPVQPNVQTGPQQVPQQTNTNVQQNPVVQPTQTASTPNSVQPVQQQQFTMPQQITMPNGQVINMQPQVPQQPASVNIKGIGTVQAPNVQQPATTPAQSQQPTAAQQNAEYEAQKQQEAEKEQYNQLVGEYMKAGGNPNAIRQENDPYIERTQPTAEQVQQAQANTQKQAQTDNDEIQKTLKEYLDSKYESPEDREKREKREARQRKWAAISEGLANVFNLGGAIGGALPGQWKDGVGDLYANQQAEADKRRLEYRQALKDMTDYRTAIRNGDIAQARAIEERRKNDFYERKMLEDIASKQANDELKKQKQEADIKRNDQQQANRNEEHKAKMQGSWNPSGSAKGSSKSGGSGKSRGRGRSGGSRATGAAAAKSAKAAAKRRAKAATQGTKFGKK